jgi:hypothetical protein
VIVVVGLIGKVTTDQIANLAASLYLDLWQIKIQGLLVEGSLGY